MKCQSEFNLFYITIQLPLMLFFFLPAQGGIDLNQPGMNFRMKGIDPFRFSIKYQCRLVAFLQKVNFSQVGQGGGEHRVILEAFNQQGFGFVELLVEHVGAGQFVVQNRRQRRGFRHGLAVLDDSGLDELPGF